MSHQLPREQQAQSFSLYRVLAMLFLEQDRPLHAIHSLCSAAEGRFAPLPATAASGSGSGVDGKAAAATAVMQQAITPERLSAARAVRSSRDRVL